MNIKLLTLGAKKRIFSQDGCSSVGITGLVSAFDSLSRQAGSYMRQRPLALDRLSFSVSLVTWSENMSTPQMAAVCFPSSLSTIISPKLVKNWWPYGQGDSVSQSACFENMLWWYSIYSLLLIPTLTLLGLSCPEWRSRGSR